MADFNEAFIRRMVAFSGRDLFGAGYEPTTWNYPESVGYTKEEVDGVWASIKNDGTFWYSLFGYPETQDAINYLTDRMVRHGDDVYFITARPGKNAKKQTELWLHDRFKRSYLSSLIPTVLISSHKGLCAQALGLDVYIDDRWENCLETRAAGVETFLLDRPWNKKTEQRLWEGEPGGCYLVDTDLAFEYELHRTKSVVGICEQLWGSVPTVVPTSRIKAS